MQQMFVIFSGIFIFISYCPTPAPFVGKKNKESFYIIKSFSNLAILSNQFSTPYVYKLLAKVYLSINHSQLLFSGKRENGFVSHLPVTPVTAFAGTYAFKFNLCFELI